MTRYLQLIVLFNLSILSCLKAQQATIHLSLLDNDTGKPLETPIKWHSTKTNRDVVFKTDKLGKVVVVLEGNQTYETSIPQSQEVYDVVLPNTPNFSKEILLKFTIENPPIENPSVSMIQQKQAEIVYQNLVGVQTLNKPSNKSLEVIDMDSQKTVYSSLNDTNRFNLPIKRRYKLAIRGVSIQNDVFDMPSFSPTMRPYVLYFNTDNSAHLFPMNEENTVINLIYTNLMNKIVVGDSILLISKKNGKQYRLLTEKNGSALFIVPKNDSYEIHLKHFDKIATIGVENTPQKGFSTFTYTISYPSAKEVENRKREEVISKAERDSAYKIYKKEIDLNPLEFNKRMKKAIAEFSDYNEYKLRVDDRSKHLLKKDNEVGEVLTRLKDKSTSKIIVADVTGSMYPYLEQLALWLSFDLMKKEKNAYVFFNDGDRKMDYQKRIGNTGGIYTTESTVIDSVVGVMHTAMNSGSGGDGAENNIEALLIAQKLGQPSSEIIMIVDNYSCIKDIRLLPDVTKPVHIILCGVNVLTGINPDYLWVAYKTKGTIHTIEDDITDLGSMMEGKIITIRGRTYKLLSNRFFEIK